MTDDERRELVKRYLKVKKESLIRFHKSEFDGRVLSRRFELEREIIREFVEMHGGETSA